MYFHGLKRAGVSAAGILLLSACGGGGNASLLPAADAGNGASAQTIVLPTAVPTAAPSPGVARGMPLLPAAPSLPAAPAASAPARASSAPTQAPTSAPGRGSASSLLSWADGQQIPVSFASGFFGATGPLYQQLPAAPQLDQNSSAAIAYYFGGGASEYDALWIDADQSQAKYDYDFPIYVASASDPLVTIGCNHLCSDEGVQIRLPALARQAGGDDHHLGVLEPDGTEYDFWLVSSNPPYANGSLLSAAGEGSYALNGSAFGPHFIAPAFDSASATAGGIALSAGQIYVSELAAGSINHAIALEFPCATSAWVYPASQLTGTCANGQGMPLGARVWWQPSDVQTAAMPLARDMKTLLVALHRYGGFFTDNGAGTNNINGQGAGMSMHTENQEPYWIYGNGADPVARYAANEPGWNHVVNGSGLSRYLLSASAADVDFANNLKVLAPCVTQKTC